MQIKNVGFGGFELKDFGGLILYDFIKDTGFISASRHGLRLKAVFEKALKAIIPIRYFWTPKDTPRILGSIKVGKRHGNSQN